jgi:hypothetical protein
MVTIEKRFSNSIRMNIEAQWNAISNLIDDFTRARRRVQRPRKTAFATRN